MLLYLLVLESSILNLQVLVELLKVLNSGLVLGLPLFHNFLLLYHDLVSSLFSVPVLLLGLKQLVFKLSDLDVAIVVQFIDSVVVNHLQSVQLTDRSILLISDGVDQFSEPLVFDKVPIVVLHVPVQLDLELMHLNFSVLSLCSHGLYFFSLLLALVDERPVVLLILHLALVNLLRVLLILLVGLLLEVSPLVDHFVQLLLEGVSLNFLLFLLVQGIA